MGTCRCRLARALRLGTARDQAGALGPLSIAQGRRLSSDQVVRSSRRSKARDSARRSVTCFCSERARVRITARSLRFEEEPASASALPRRSRTTDSSRASFARSGRSRSWPQNLDATLLVLTRSDVDRQLSRAPKSRGPKRYPSEGEVSCPIATIKRAPEVHSSPRRTVF
jgi:hypothetical protein